MKYLQYLSAKYIGLAIKKTESPVKIPKSDQREGSLYIAFAGVATAGKSTLRQYYLKPSILKTGENPILQKGIGVFQKFTIPGKRHSTAIVYPSFTRKYRSQIGNLKDGGPFQNYMKDTILLLDTRDIFREFPYSVDFLLEKKGEVAKS